MDNKDHITQILQIDPADLNEPGACEIMGILLSASKKIDTQLSAQKRTFSSGELMTAEQYRQWRTRAITAKNHIVAQYQKVKERLKDIRREKYGKV